LDEGCDAVEGGSEGVDGADLGADVDANAGGDEPLRLGRAAVESASGGDVDAELVGGEAGGDVGVGLGEDVGVDAEGEAGGAAEEFGAGGEEIEFGGGFDVEEKDSGFEGGVNLGDLLADTGEDGFGNGRPGDFEDAGEFAAGDDVETGAVLSEELEQGERGVGLDGVADGVGNACEGALEEREAREDVLRGVDVEGGSVSGGERGEGDGVAAEGAMEVGEGAGIGRGLADRSVLRG